MNLALQLFVGFWAVVIYLWLIGFIALLAPGDEE